MRPLLRRVQCFELVETQGLPMTAVERQYITDRYTDKLKMLKAYLDLMTQPSRALYMFLKHSAIPHSVNFVALRKGEQFSPEFTKINPFQLVPAVDEDGWIIPESIAILQYLCDKHGLDDLYPKDLKKRALIDSYTNWQHLNIRFGGAMLFHQLANIPKLMGKPGDPVMVEHSLKVFKASLSKMENIFLKDTPYLYSDTLTIADFFGVSELNTPRLGLCLDVPQTSYPKINAWVDRVRQSIGSDLYDETHQHITKAGQSYKAKGKIPKL